MTLPITTLVISGGKCRSPNVRNQFERVLKSALLATGEGSNARRALLKESNFRKCVRIYDFLRYAPGK